MNMDETRDGSANSVAASLREAVEPILFTHLSRMIDQIIHIRLAAHDVMLVSSPELGTTDTRPSLPSVGIEYIYGLESINQAIAAAVGSSSHEIVTAQPGGPRPEAVLDAALETVRDQLATGIRMRTLYQHSTRFDESTKKYARAILELGCELRTLDEFFERLIIVDRGTAFIPAAADNTSAMKVTEPALVRFLVDLFDRTWDRAAPFPYRPNRAREAAPEIMPDMRQAITRLLVEGHSDKAISRRLGISERTLSTHVAWLRTRFGAASRIQLGYRLAMDQLGGPSTPSGEPLPTAECPSDVARFMPEVDAGHPPPEPEELMLTVPKQAGGAGFADWRA